MDYQINGNKARFSHYEFTSIQKQINFVFGLPIFLNLSNTSKHYRYYASETYYLLLLSRNGGTRFTAYGEL